MTDLIRQQSILQDHNWRKFNSMYHEVALKIGLPETALWVMYTLSRSWDSHTQNELAHYLCVPRQTINAAVKNLKDAGFVALEQRCGMRSGKSVCLTEAGIDKCKRDVIPLIDAELRALSRLTEQEREQLITIYEKRMNFFEEEISSLLSNGATKGG